ncbi:MAG: hypothetical protein Q7R62_01500 [bacterium]|nr:hypothetical protein [bacterium]
MGLWEVEETSGVFERLLWGITRDGKWVLGLITPTTIHLCAPASPELIAQAGREHKAHGFLGLPTIWLEMVQMVENVYQARRRLLEDITNLREATGRAHSLLYRARVEWGQVPVF